MNEVKHEHGKYYMYQRANKGLTVIFQREYIKKCGFILKLILVQIIASKLYSLLSN